MTFAPSREQIVIQDTSPSPSETEKTKPRGRPSKIDEFYQSCEKKKKFELRKYPVFEVTFAYKGDAVLSMIKHLEKSLDVPFQLAISVPSKRNPAMAEENVVVSRRCNAHLDKGMFLAKKNGHHYQIEPEEFSDFLNHQNQD